MRDRGAEKDYTTDRLMRYAMKSFKPAYACLELWSRLNRTWSNFGQITSDLQDGTILTKPNYSFIRANQFVCQAGQR